MNEKLPEAAVEAAALALANEKGLVYARADVALPQVSTAVLTAAFPHIRRAVIEGLIAKADETGRLSRAVHSACVLSWLRAELEDS